MLLLPLKSMKTCYKTDALSSRDDNVTFFTEFHERLIQTDTLLRWMVMSLLLNAMEPCYKLTPWFHLFWIYLALNQWWYQAVPMVVVSYIFCNPCLADGCQSVRHDKGSSYWKVESSETSQKSLLVNHCKHSRRLEFWEEILASEYISWTILWQLFWKYFL